MSKTWLWRRVILCPKCNEQVRVFTDYKLGSPATTQELDKEPCQNCVNTGKQIPKIWGGTDGYNSNSN